MAELMQKMLEGLVATSPLVALLAFALWQVWSAYRELQKDFIAFLKGVVDEKGGGTNHGPGERS